MHCPDINRSEEAIDNVKALLKRHAAKTRKRFN